MERGGAAPGAERPLSGLTFKRKIALNLPAQGRVFRPKDQWAFPVAPGAWGEHMP